jgi:hypothetical protein
VAPVTTGSATCTSPPPRAFASPFMRW